VSRGNAQWLLTTVNAVREVMLKRLHSASPDPELERDMQMALEELDVMWEELQGQSELLSRENERYAEFFDFAPDAYIITDAGANVREANRAACELLRAAHKDLVGRPLSEFIAEMDRVAFLSRFVAMAVQGSQPASWRCRMQPREGGEAFAMVSVRAIPLKKSGIGGLCWLIRPEG
jgi:PAS domain S-box-containing protein